MELLLVVVSFHTIQVRRRLREWFRAQDGVDAALAEEQLDKLERELLGEEEMNPRIPGPSVSGEP